MEPADQSTPSSSPAVADSAPVVRRGRPGRIVIAAVLAELVVIAAVGNQGVVHALRKNLDTRNYADYARGGIEAATTFSWRFAPESGQATHVWAAQFAAIGALVVLTALAVLAVARGVVTFGRVFVAVWAVVAAVTPVAVMVRQFVIVPSAPGPLQSRVGQSVYGYLDFGAVIVAGLGLGLIVGLFTGLLAMITRTKPRVDDDEDGEYLDGNFAPRGTQQTAAYEPPPWGVEPPSSAPMSDAPMSDAPTSVQPRADYPPVVPQSPPWGSPQRQWESDEQHTEQLPTREQIQGPESAQESTQQFAAERPFATERQPPPPQSAPAAPPSAPRAPEAPPADNPPSPVDETDATAQIPAIPEDDERPTQ
jgi:hypothetical protein